MAEKIVIVAGGTMRNRRFHSRILKQADKIICADGGANMTVAFGFIPDIVIGDMDSIKKGVLKKLKNNGKTQIIEDPDQNKTDTELALSLAMKFKPKEIIILGAIGDRFDHTLANILCLDRVKGKTAASIVDDKNEIRLMDKDIEVIGEKNGLVSVIPLTAVKGLTYDGLKWTVRNKNCHFGWFGISNRLTKKKAKVKVKRGKVVVMKSVDA